MNYEECLAAGRRFIEVAPVHRAQTVTKTACAAAKRWSSRQDAAMAVLIAAAAPIVLRLIAVVVEPWVAESSIAFLFRPTMYVATGSFHVLLLVAAALLSRRPQVGPQVIVRSILVAIVFINLRSIDSFQAIVVPRISVILFWGAGTALILLGRRRLEPDDGPFQPVAFRDLLMGAIILAGATSIVYLHSIVLNIEGGLSWQPSLLLTHVLPFVVLGSAAIGLFRLRSWGLLIHVAGNLLLAGIWVWLLLFWRSPNWEDWSSPANLQNLALWGIQLVLVMPVLIVIFWRQLRR